MLLRAVFWIAVVSVLMPREPDLGYGRPAGTFQLGTDVARWAEAAASVSGCRDQRGVCTALPGIMGVLKGNALRSLAQVKAELEEQRHLRSLHYETTSQD